MRPEDLRESIGRGLTSFPVTPFDAAGHFDCIGFGAHLKWLQAHRPSAFFIAGGTGEFFSLEPAEIVGVVDVAVKAATGVPIVAGCGLGTRQACALARDLEATGADGLLLLPPYLIDAPQDGLAEHVRAVCKSTRLGVIAYRRANCTLRPDTLVDLADECPNLIGVKDGIGDIETVRRIAACLGERMVMLGGMPTHELYAEAYRAAGFTTYSSAVFNFVPQTAIEFFEAVACGNRVTCDRLLHTFFLPFAAIRDRKAGYAVSAVKAAVNLRGFEVGSVRPPLTDLTLAEIEELRTLVDAFD